MAALAAADDLSPEPHGHLGESRGVQPGRSRAVALAPVSPHALRTSQHSAAFACPAPARDMCPDSHGSSASVGLSIWHHASALRLRLRPPSTSRRDGSARVPLSLSVPDKRGPVECTCASMIHALCPCRRAGTAPAQRSDALRVPAPGPRCCWRRVYTAFRHSVVHDPARIQRSDQTGRCCPRLVPTFLHPGLLAAQIQIDSQDVGTGGGEASADRNLAARGHLAPKIALDPGLRATSVHESDGSPAVAAAVTWPRRSLGPKKKAPRTKTRRRHHGTGQLTVDGSRGNEREQPSSHRTATGDGRTQPGRAAAWGPPWRDCKHLPIFVSPRYCSAGRCRDWVAHACRRRPWIMLHITICNVHYA